MRRLASVTLFPLFALFYLALSGSAAAATPPNLPLNGGYPPQIGVGVSAVNQAPLTDQIDWVACDSVGDIGPVLLANSETFTLASTGSATDPDVCAIETPIGLATPVLFESNPVGPVGPGPILGAAATPVTQGQTLTVTQGAWGGATISDAWEDCTSGGACAPVASGATGVSYTVTRSDVGSTIAVQETAPPPAGASSVTETTAPTGVVSATPPVLDVTSPPTVSGTPQVGDTLTAAPGNWSNQPTSYTYQWESCSSGTCTPIQNATSSTYMPVAADIGDILVVSVAGAIDPGAPYGAVGSPYPSYPTNPVLGIATSPSPTPAPGPVVPVVHPHRNVVGRLTATMRWTFRYAPTYTQVLALAVDGPAFGSTIATRCRGRGCPFHVHRITVRRSAHCSKTTHHCHVPRSVNLEWEFRHHKLRVGTRVMIRISRAHDIGKYYRFVVRPGRAPSARIRCLAPGSAMPGKGCTGL